jgi:predicted DNA-binding protein YlxM (UPF0122 family)
MKPLITTLLLFFFTTSLSWSQDRLKQSYVDDDLSEKEAADLKNRTKQRIAELQNYLNIIPDSKRSTAEREDAVEQALLLFTNEANMEIIDRKGKRTMPVKRYFRNLLDISTGYYTHIDITQYDVAYVSDFRLGTDGNYHSTGTYYQDFKGFRGDQAVYHDRTKKDVSIRADARLNEYNEKKWTLLLGNVKARSLEVIPAN